MTLCNDRRAGRRGTNRRDPTELALLDLSARYGLQPAGPGKGISENQELAFDSTRKMMSTFFHQRGNQTVTLYEGRAG